MQVNQKETSEHSLLSQIDNALKYNNNLKVNRQLDPVLPTFQSTETSQGPYDLNFELSNQDGASKSRDNFQLAS